MIAGFKIVCSERLNADRATGFCFSERTKPGPRCRRCYSYWREFGARYVTALCTRQDSDAPRKGARLRRLHPMNWSAWRWAAPPMMGAEYLTAAVLDALWQELDAAFELELAESKCGVQDFLKRRNPAWNLVGRVHFNVAENRKDADAPFAFLATYTTRLSAQAKAQHLPLGQALREYAGAANKERLLSLLVPVQRASETCPWLKAMVDAGEIFHPLRWTPREALQLLRDVPQLETAGVVVRMPAAWRGNRPPRPRVTGTRGRQGAVGTRAGRAARFPDGSHARWRIAHRRRDPRSVGENRWPGAGARALGRDSIASNWPA